MTTDLQNVPDGPLEECRKWVANAAKLARLGVCTDGELMSATNGDQVYAFVVCAPRHHAKDFKLIPETFGTSFAMCPEDLEKDGYLSVLEGRWCAAVDSMWRRALEPMLFRNVERYGQKLKAERAAKEAQCV